MVELHLGGRAGQHQDIRNLKLCKYRLLFCLRLLRMAFGQLALKEGGVTAFSESTGAVVMLVCGLIATLIATIVVTRVTMRALNDVMDDGGAV